MLARAAVCLALSLLPAGGADWNPRLAAQYLDSRQKEWFVWPRANAAAKPCVSCHTGVTYLLARPALGKALGEDTPTVYETGLLASLRSRMDQKEPAAAPGLGVESILAARFLATGEALERMWALQVREGAAKGAWNWFSLDRDPWEMAESRFYGRPPLSPRCCRQRRGAPWSTRSGSSSSPMAVGPWTRSARSRRTRKRRVPGVATPTPPPSPPTRSSRPAVTRRTPNLPALSPGWARTRTRNAAAGRPSP